jgi:hypothetical protein
MNSNSQAFQDIFALSLFGNDGTYIEIGAHKPVKNSNTYKLEVEHAWKGFSIEFDSRLKRFWEKHPERKNTVYWDNALTFNYKDAIISNNLPMHINYLSCDIEPPENTFAALKKIIEDGVTFDCITFEHDLYQSTSDVNIIAIEFLKSHGYKVAVTDVFYRVPENHFETWFIKENIHFPTLKYVDWINTLK